MKKIFLIVLLCTTGVLYAQRTSGGWAIQARYGLMEGRGQMNTFFGAFPEGIATSGSIGVSKIIANKGFMAEGNLFVNDYFVDKNKLNLPYRLYGLNIMGGWSYENLYPIFINLKLGAFAGIERINNGVNRDSEYGIIFPFEVTSLTYGIVGVPEVEIIIWNKLSALLTYSQYMNVNSPVSHWKYSLELGLKWYF